MSIPQNLLCGVCENLYDDPRSLPKCSHTFCFGCIEKIRSYSIDSRVRVVCPFCKSQNTFQNISQLDEIKNDIILSGITKVLKESGFQLKEESNNCFNFNSCKNKSLWYCYSDKLFMCGECKNTLHNGPLVKNHEIVLQSKVEPLKIVCKEHGGSSLYCKDCSQIVCPNCHFSSSPGHRMTLIEREVLDIMSNWRSHNAPNSLLRFLNEREGEIIKDEKELEESIETLQKKLDVLRQEHKIINEYQVSIRSRNEYLTSIDSFTEPKIILSSTFRKESELEPHSYVKKVRKDLIDNGLFIKTWKFSDDYKTNNIRLERPFHIKVDDCLMGSILGSVPIVKSGQWILKIYNLVGELNVGITSSPNRMISYSHNEYYGVTNKYKIVGGRECNHIEPWNPKTGDIICFILDLSMNKFNIGNLTTKQSIEFQNINYNNNNKKWWPQFNISGFNSSIILIESLEWIDMSTF